jgi:hypothetical protein
MGAAWWFPASNSATWWTDPEDFEEISLGTTRGMLTYDPLRTAERLELGHGLGTHFLHGGGQRVRIQYSMGGDEDLADRHVAMVSALREGKPVSYAQETNHAWALPLDDPDRGETVLPYLAGNPFSDYATVTEAGSATRCLIQSALPELRREIVDLVSADSGANTMTIAGLGSHTGLVKSYLTTDDQDRNPWIRPVDFLPFLRLVPGQGNILRQVNGMPWAFDAWFLCDVGLEAEHIGFVDA